MQMQNLPGPRAREIIHRDQSVVSRSYPRAYPFVMDYGRGVEVWDVDGNRFLDFAAGIAVANVGHTNPEVVQAIRKQAMIGLHSAFPDFHAELPLQFIEKLLRFMPKGFHRAFLSNSGTESV